MLSESQTYNDGSSPIISLCVPVYNTACYLPRCLESLASQTIADAIEYVIVDDASTDNSAEILERWLSDNPNLNIRIIRNSKNGGLAYSRRVAILASTGKYLSFCDSDDWIEPDMLENMVANAESSQAKMVSCAFVREWDNRSKVELLGVDTLRLNDVPCDVAHFSMWSKMIKREVLVDNDLLPTVGLDCWEDLNVTSRAMALVGDVPVIDVPYYHYRQAVGHSLTSQAQGRVLSDRMVNARIVLEWFENRGAEFCAQYSDFLLRIKFSAKLKMLRVCPPRIGEWRRTWRECRNDLFRVQRQYPLFWRIVFWMLSR